MYTIYRFFAKNGALLYVGCTSRFDVRMKMHKSQSPWASQFATTDLIKAPDKRSALAIERALIASGEPRHNKNKRHIEQRSFTPTDYVEFLSSHIKKNADIVTMRQNGSTMQEIARKHKLSRQRVHQILKRESEKRK